MIYKPREDTYLLKKAVEDRDLKGLKVLEIGTGSGLIAETALENGADVTATDINPEALKQLPEEVEGIESDLFENVEGRFDLILFNPPYLPGEESEASMKGSETWFGGESGVDVLEDFLNSCGSYLNNEGEAFLVMSSLSKFEEVVEKFGLEKISEKKLFFERLYLMRYCVE
ncbi:MAG: HemK2/MTQ2 family protein methyltransferase [Candidatus Nanohaloarchaea archaeon]